MPRRHEVRDVAEPVGVKAPAERAEQLARGRPGQDTRRASGAACPTRDARRVSANAQATAPAAICPQIGAIRSSANATASTARQARASRRPPLAASAARTVSLPGDTGATAALTASSSRGRISGSALSARSPARSRIIGGVAARLDDVELRVSVALLADRAVAETLGRDHDRPVAQPREESHQHRRRRSRRASSRASGRARESSAPPSARRRGSCRGSR